MAAFPIDEEADLKAVGAKGPFGEKVRHCHKLCGSGMLLCSSRARAA